MSLTSSCSKAAIFAYHKACSFEAFFLVIRFNLNLDCYFVRLSVLTSRVANLAKAESKSYHSERIRLTIRSL